MSLSQSSGIGFGAVQATATSDGGLPPEFWIDDIVRQIVHVSDNAPPAIRDQAFAYRDTIHVVVGTGVRSAILSNHTTIIHQLRKAGMEEAALLVLSLRS